MLINLTNRSLEGWSEKQKTAAQEYGEIVDFPMPAISPDADEAEADRIAGLVLRRVLKRLKDRKVLPEEDKLPDEDGTLPDKDERSGGGISRDMVICQGDFTLVFRIVSRLKEEGIPVAAPTFERVMRQVRNPDGSIGTGYHFEFVRFRSY